MCYARLGDIVEVLADLEVDVVSLEAARSDMALVTHLERASYRSGVGPGVYDVHAPRVPDVAEIESLLRRALETLGPERLWVNPDCGLKTRSTTRWFPPCKTSWPLPASCGPSWRAGSRCTTRILSGPMP